MLASCLCTAINKLFLYFHFGVSVIARLLLSAHTLGQADGDFLYVRESVSEWEREKERKRERCEMNEIGMPPIQYLQQIP